MWFLKIQINLNSQFNYDFLKFLCFEKTGIGHDFHAAIIGDKKNFDFRKVFYLSNTRNEKERNVMYF